MAVETIIAETGLDMKAGSCAPAWLVVFLPVSFPVFGPGSLERFPLLCQLFGRQGNKWGYPGRVLSRYWRSHPFLGKVPSGWGGFSNRGVWCLFFALPDRRERFWLLQPVH